MKRQAISRTLIALSIAALLVAIGTDAFLSGYWIPNFPSYAKFPVRGIDVSRHQGEIQWGAIPHDLAQFVYIKATEGGDFQDKRFAENWAASGKAGFRRGAYHFYTLKTSGAKQAENFIATVPKEIGALPPVVDLEFTGNSTTRPTKEEFRKELEIFVTALKNTYGSDPIFYVSSEFREAYFEDFPIEKVWVPSFFVSPPLMGQPDWSFWQFSDRGRTPGIKGFVDLNVFRGTKTDFEKILAE
jgi:lysozyme